MKWVLFIFFALAGCSLFEKPEDIKSAMFYVKVYYGGGTFTAAPQVEWLSNDVVIATEYFPTSYSSDDYRHSGKSFSWDHNKIYPDFSSRVTYRNGFGTVLKTDTSHFSWSIKPDLPAYTNFSFYL